MFIFNLAGWKRNLLAFVFGVLATLTLAPFSLFPLLIPAFTGLFLLISHAPNRKRIFWDGWWWGWGFYISGLYWFCIALLTDVEHFAWLIPFALFGITGIIAIYCGLACWITSLLFPSPLVGEGGEGGISPHTQTSSILHHPPLPNPPPPGGREFSKIFVFSVVWTGVELARGYLFSGFPWNLIGYSFGFSDVSLQLGSLVGVYGLTWFAVLLGSSFALLGFRIQDSGFRKNIWFVVFIWSLFAIGLGWGAWRLHEADLVAENERTVPGVMLRLVQANIAQPHKWDPKLELQGLKEQIRLTQLPGLEKVTHVIWPETAVPYAVEAGSPMAHQLGASVLKGQILITGALRVEGDRDDFEVWNSLMAIDSSGNIMGSYDKAKLVPFGEFLPFRSFLPKAWLTPVGEKDFSRGLGAQTVEWKGLPPLSPLICYEVIFPERVVDQNRRPQLLLNVTNDAWFGMSTGPYQHFEMSRMRAVEQGIPLVRVANTGISAEIDSYGRVVSKLGLGKQGVIDIKLQKAQPYATTYGKYNNIFLLLMSFFAMILILKQYKCRNN